MGWVQMKELDDFYKYLENKGYSNNTILSYQKDLNQFKDYCKNISIKKIDYKQSVNTIPDIDF